MLFCSPRPGLRIPTDCTGRHTIPSALSREPPARRSSSKGISARKHHPASPSTTQHRRWQVSRSQVVWVRFLQRLCGVCGMLHAMLSLPFWARVITTSNASAQRVQFYLQQVFAKCAAERGRGEIKSHLSSVPAGGAQQTATHVGAAPPAKSHGSAASTASTAVPHPARSAVDALVALQQASYRRALPLRARARWSTRSTLSRASAEADGPLFCLVW